jgi:hypothetical protein
MRLRERSEHEEAAALAAVGFHLRLRRNR